MYFFKNNRGVTLIELMVVIAILSLVIVMASGLMTYSVSAYKYDDAWWQIQQDARTAIDQVTREARSKKLSINDGRLVMEGFTEDEDSEKEIEAVITIKLRGSAGPKELVREVKNIHTGRVTSNTIVRNVKDVSFTREEGIITMDIVTQKPGTDAEFSLSSKIYSRVE